MQNLLKDLQLIDTQGLKTGNLDTLNKCNSSKTFSYLFTIFVIEIRNEHIIRKLRSSFLKTNTTLMLLHNLLSHLQIYPFHF